MTTALTLVARPSLTTRESDDRQTGPLETEGPIRGVVIGAPNEPVRLETVMRLRLLAASAVAVLAFAACGGATTPSPGATTASSPSAPASEAPASEAPASSAPASEAPAEDATVTVVDSDHGEILADAEGNVLYGFTPDTAGDSTCYDACEEAWPPLIADGDPVAGEGVDATLSTTTRTGGEIQVKAGEWPLYYFAGDQNPGDTNGQGLQGVWFVVSPSGELIEE